MKTRNRSKDDYPSVHSWNYITIEGYCMLNTEYGMCSSRYNYLMKPDGSFMRQKNDRYDPAATPDPFPDTCTQSVRPSCIGCRHFAWCEPEHAMRPMQSVRPRTVR